LYETSRAYWEGRPGPSLLNPGKKVELKFIEQADKEIEETRQRDKERIKKQKEKLIKVRPSCCDSQSSCGEEMPESSPPKEKPVDPPLIENPEPEAPPLIQKPEPVAPPQNEKPVSKLRAELKKPTAPKAKKKAKVHPKAAREKTKANRPKVKPVNRKPRKTRPKPLLSKEKRSKTTSGATAPQNHKPPNKVGKATKKSSTCSITTLRPMPSKPLVKAPESQSGESGACPKGSYSNTRCPRKGLQRLARTDESKTQPEKNPRAGGRGGRRTAVTPQVKPGSAKKIHISW
jgi:hypothetical protein